MCQDYSMSVGAEVCCLKSSNGGTCDLRKM